MLQIKIGEQKAINYSLKMKSTSLPVNLTNSKIIFQVKENENQIDNFLIEKTITETSEESEMGKIYDPENGKFSVFFKAEDTLSLEINRDYFYTIWRIFENTKEVISSQGLKVEEFLVCPD